MQTICLHICHFDFHHLNEYFEICTFKISSFRRLDEWSLGAHPVSQRCTSRCCFSITLLPICHPKLSIISRLDVQVAQAKRPPPRLPSQPSEESSSKFRLLPHIICNLSTPPSATLPPSTVVLALQVHQLTMTITSPRCPSATGHATIECHSGLECTHRVLRWMSPLCDDVDDGDDEYTTGKRRKGPRTWFNEGSRWRSSSPRVT
ncbi:hypothetical protein BDN72DRAFT_505144 [Pluteus cervinus]|uniref:Uncharacterized protein n=1 Tax=Pluteus cervinus TaxID=181527 RepID=A0ACD3AYZ3_9AGAR|nr:hypothetical protein BDN72DRAFT_505144 [Pluteus cervinus]